MDFFRFLDLKNTLFKSKKGGRILKARVSNFIVLCSNDQFWGQTKCNEETRKYSLCKHCGLNL